MIEIDDRTLRRLAECPTTRLHVRAIGEMILERRAGHRLAVLMADLDGLKAVNDLCGHAAGDALLRLAAEVIRANVRAEDVVIRWGGDEVVVILSDIDTADAARIRLADALDGRFGVRASVGLGVGPADDAIRQADVAMYAAKAAQR